MAMQQTPIRRWAFALIATPLLCSLSAKVASASDATATKAYLQANYRLVATTNAKIPQIEATLHGVLTRVRRECPLAAANSPEDADSEQLSNEVIGAMVTAVVALDRPAGTEFVKAATGLSWSNGPLTHTIRSYVGKVKTLVALPEPNLCSDIASWAASGYQTLPASTLAFSPRFMSVWVAPGELPAGLGRYETAAERPLVARTHDLEEVFTELEARAVTTWAAIMNTLELQP